MKIDVKMLRNGEKVSSFSLGVAGLVQGHLQKLTRLGLQVGVAALLLSGSSAMASISTWQGASGGDWNTPGNWMGGEPVASSTALFNTGYGSSITVANAVANQPVTSITFDTSAGNYTIGATNGNDFLLTSTGTILIASTITGSNLTETINSPLVISSGSTAAGYAFDNNSATTSNTLQIDGAVSLGTSGASTLTLRGANTGTNTVSGNISNGSAGGTLALNKTDAGTWIVSGSNSYTGGTSIVGGILSISADNNLGAAPGSPTAGSLAINSATLATTASFTLNSNRGIALGQTGSTTHGGTISVASGTTLNYGGIIANAGTGTGTLTLSGSGTIDLSGASTYSGGTTISAGTVVLGNASALGSTAGTITLPSNDSATLDLATDTSVNAYNFTVGGSGTYTFASDKATSGTAGITQTLGTLSISTSTLDFVAGSNVTGGSPVVAFGATTLSSGSGGTSTFNPTTANVTLTSVVGDAGATSHVDSLALGGTSTGNAITGSITDNGGGTAGSLSISKSSTSTWTLSGSNSYAGTTAITGGILQFAIVDAMSAHSAVSVSSGGTLAVNVGGTSQFTGTTTAVAGSVGGLLQNVGGQGAGVSFASGSFLGLDTTNASGGSFTYTGAITNAGIGLTKLGTGTLVLSSSGSTYSGVTTIDGGDLQVDAAETAGTSGPLGKSAAANAGSIVFGGGTLQYSSANHNDYSGRFSTAANQAISIDTNGQNVTFATALTSSGGSLTLADSATGGSLTLSNTNTYTGATTVNSGGRLIVSGSTASGSAVTINSGGTLAGASAATEGTLNGSVTVAGGGTINLKDGTIGTLHTGALTLGGGTASAISFDIGASSVDSIASSGSLTMSGSTTISLGYVSGTPSLTPGTYNLITYTGSLTSAQFSDFSLNTSALTGASADSFSLVNVAGDVELQISLAAPAAAYYTGGAAANTTDINTAGNFVTTAGGGTTTTSAIGLATDVYLTANSAVNETPTLNTGTGTSINSLTFTGTGTSATAGVTLSGSKTLTIGGGSGVNTPGIYDQAGSGADTISAPVALGVSQAWSNASGNLLTVSGGVSGSGNLALAANSTGGITVSTGAVNPTGSITNSGSGSGTTTISSSIGTNVTGVTENSSTSNLILSGNNTYTSPTTVTTGKLYVNNTAGSGTGSGTVTVNGGTLAGSGTITSSGVTVNAGGTLASGDAQGSAPSVDGTHLTFSNTNVALSGTGTGASSANLTFDLGAGTDHLGSGSPGAYNFTDPITDTTSMDLTGTSKLTFTTGSTESVSLVDLTSAATLSLRTSTPYLLISAGTDSDYVNLVINSGTTANPILSLSQNDTTTDGYVLGVWTGSGLGYTPIAISQFGPNGTTPLVANSTVYPDPVLYLDGGDLEVVPEPGTYALMLGGLLVLVVLQKFRQRA